EGTIVGASIIMRDITARKRMEKGMIEALATLDATVDGAFSFDPQTLQFAYVNEGAVRQVGYSREELLRMTPLDLNPEFDEPRFRAMVAPLASGAELVHSFTTVHRRKDGVDVPVEINLQCVGAGTSQARLIAIVRDITERKQAQEKFRRVVEGAPNAMILVDRKGIIALVNAQTETLFGYSREELLGQSIETLVPARFRGAHPGHRAEFFAHFKMRAMGAGRDLYGLHKDGREIPIEISLNPIETVEGLMVLSSIMDITERKRAQEVLRESEERFRTLANNMSQLAWMADAQGWIFWYNRRWFEYSGTTLEDMEAWGWQKVHHPEHVQRVVDKMRHCFRTGEVWEDTFPLRGKDGNYRWFLSRAVPIRNEEGEVFRWFGTNTDVTEQRESEDALKENRERLEAVNKELEAFSYSVSHDLRAPLRSIDGFSQALLEDCAGRLNEQEKDHLSRIRAASQRMGQLIDDLLKLARLSRQDLCRRPVDVSELAQSEAADLRQAWPNRQVNLTVAPGLMADADPVLFRVVLGNLLGNAWKFTSKQARAAIEVGAMSHDGTTAYFVRDNGVGFDMAYADKLFGAFQRLHAITEYPGTGIGLATVQRIVARHGGRVWAEGQAGQGATFYFTLGERSAQ
ncbi:MAG TPA: PAS domain S-box protein, partial [Nitrospira sp.]